MRFHRYPQRKTSINKLKSSFCFLIEKLSNKTTSCTVLGCSREFKFEQRHRGCSISTAQYVYFDIVKKHLHRSLKIIKNLLGMFLKIKNKQFYFTKIKVLPIFKTNCAKVELCQSINYTYTSFYCNDQLQLRNLKVYLKSSLKNF